MQLKYNYVNNLLHLTPIIYVYIGKKNIYIW